MIKDMTISGKIMFGGAYMATWSSFSLKSLPLSKPSDCISTSEPSDCINHQLLCSLHKRRAFATAGWLLSLTSIFW